MSGTFKDGKAVPHHPNPSVVRGDLPEPISTLSLFSRSTISTIMATLNRNFSAPYRKDVSVLRNGDGHAGLGWGERIWDGNSHLPEGEATVYRYTAVDYFRIARRYLPKDAKYSMYEVSIDSGSSFEMVVQSMQDGIKPHRIYCSVEGLDTLRSTLASGNRRSVETAFNALTLSLRIQIDEFYTLHPDLKLKSKADGMGINKVIIDSCSDANPVAGCGDPLAKITGLTFSFSPTKTDEEKAAIRKLFAAAIKDSPAIGKDGIAAIFPTGIKIVDENDHPPFTGIGEPKDGE